jgi:hypothetical protein
MHLAHLVPHQKGWTWSQMTENWIGYLLKPSWALLVHQNGRNCVLKVLMETLDRFGNFGPLYLTWPPPMPCTVQPRRPDQIVFYFDSTISIQYRFKINLIYIQSRFKVIPSPFKVHYSKSIIWSRLFRSRLFRSRLFRSQLFRSRIFWSRLFRSRLFRSRLFWSRLFWSRLFWSQLFQSQLFQSRLFQSRLFRSRLFRSWFKVNLKLICYRFEVNLLPSPFKVDLLSIQCRFAINSKLICYWFEVNSLSIQHQFNINSTLIQHWFNIASASIQHQFDINCRRQNHI